MRARAIAPVLGVALIATAAASAGDEKAPAWPSYHGDYDLSGRATSEVPDAPVQLWRFEAGETVYQPPIAGGGRIYFTHEKGVLFALDHGGKELWRRDVNPDAFTAPPLYVDELVVVGSMNGLLYAIRADSGEVAWKYDVEDNVMGSANRVALEGGKLGIIVTAQATGEIHCVDGKTGERLWKTSESDRCDGSVSVGEGRIVMGSCAAALHVFSIAEQRKLRDVPLGDDRQVAGGVALIGKIAYAGTRDGSLSAVDVDAGKVEWTNTDAESEAFTTPAVGKDRIIFGADDGRIYALDRKTGKKRWVYDTERPPFSPVIAGNRVVVSSGGMLFILDLANGKELWTAEVSDDITSPAIVDGMIIIGSDEGVVSAFGKKK